MKSKNTPHDTSHLLQATGRTITDGGVTYFVSPSEKVRNLRDLRGLKKNIFLVTNFLKPGETVVEFRCDTIPAITYRKAEQRHLLNEIAFKGHLYEVGEYIAEILD